MGEDQIKLLRVSVHQPQFLPWAGMMHKIVSSDLHIIMAGVKADLSGHQQRVTLDGHWMGVPVAADQRSKLVKDIKLADNIEVHLRKLVRTIRQGAMRKKDPYRERLEPIIDVLERFDGTLLLDLNVQLLIALNRSMLISTELVLDGEEYEGADTAARLDALIGRYAGTGTCEYLSGEGSRAYMGYDTLQVPARTLFQETKKGLSPDTVLQLIAREADPLGVIRASGLWQAKEGKHYDHEGKHRTGARAALR